jgi:hypothetical protein
MEVELIREIISLLKDLKAGVSVNWISIFLIGIIVLIASFLGNYIRRKGQNLATKEDISEITKKNNFDMVIKCQNWWEKNCLYLDMESRKAFMSSIHAVALHPDLTGGQATKDEVKENWRDINECGEILIRGAGLPSFAENELKAIDEIDESRANKANSADAKSRAAD